MKNEFEAYFTTAGGRGYVDGLLRLFRVGRGGYSRRDDQDRRSGFYECRALTDVYCRAGVPPLLGIQVFEGTSIKNLYVPEGSADAYREAEGWSRFEHIEEREF